MLKKVKAVDIEGKTHKADVSQLRWRPAAYGIVIRGEEVLLSKQFDGYDLPGGGIDLGETPEEAVLREIKEETGITAIQPRIVGINSGFFKNFTKEDDFVHSLAIYYICDYAGGEFSTDGFDEDEKQYADMPEWFPIKNLSEIKVSNTIDWRPMVDKAITR